MDEYGSVEITKEDATMIRRQLDEGKSVVFTISGDRIGALIILLCPAFETLGIMPFGGNPRGRIYVGVYGRGCNHFSTNEIHPGYIEEKLKITSEEAEWFSDFWKLIWEEKS